MGSRGRRLFVNRRGETVNAASKKCVYECGQGIRLETVEAVDPDFDSTLILIPGLFGHANSSYILSLAAHLWASKCNVIRVHLRDHGGSENLNEGLYHSARVSEVSNLIAGIVASHRSTTCGVVAFSMGANIALRTLPDHELPLLAVCPLVNPCSAIIRIDAQAHYRFFFVRKWHRQVNAKMLAFPEIYDFREALSLRSLRELTQYFVSVGTEFNSTEAYFEAHTICSNIVEAGRVTVIYAEDDPVIETNELRRVFAQTSLLPQAFGGHCAFISNPLQASWLDRFVADRFLPGIY